MRTSYSERLGEGARPHEVREWRGFSMVWEPCVVCRRCRWLKLKGRKPESSRCRSCASKIRYQNNPLRGENHPHWKGGRQRTHYGYIAVTLQPGDLFYPMVNTRRDNHHGRVYEHRLVMAQHLNRCLESWEIVHHKNGIKDDNRLENLELYLGKQHKQNHLLEQRVRQLEGRITVLEAGNVALQSPAPQTR